MRWRDVGGLEEVKQGLKEAVQWPHLHPDALLRLGAQPARGTPTLTLLLAPPTAHCIHAKHEVLCKNGKGAAQPRAFLACFLQPGFFVCLHCFAVFCKCGVVAAACMAIV